MPFFKTNVVQLSYINTTPVKREDNETIVASNRVVRISSHNRFLVFLTCWCDINTPVRQEDDESVLASKRVGRISSHDRFFITRHQFLFTNVVKLRKKIHEIPQIFVVILHISLLWFHCDQGLKYPIHQNYILHLGQNGYISVLASKREVWIPPPSPG